MSKKYHIDPYGIICGHNGPIHNPGESNQDAAARMLTELEAENKRLEENSSCYADVALQTVSAANQLADMVAILSGRHVVLRLDADEIIQWTLAVDLAKEIITTRKVS